MQGGCLMGQGVCRKEVEPDFWILEGENIQKGWPFLRWGGGRNHGQNYEISYAFPCNCDHAVSWKSQC